VRAAPAAARGRTSSDGADKPLRRSIAELAGLLEPLLDSKTEQEIVGPLSNPSANRCVLCRWVSVALAYMVVGAALWYGCDQLLFASACAGTCEAATAIEKEGRTLIQWSIGWALGYLHVVVLLWFAKNCCERVTGFSGRAGSWQRF
jgi:hypothetical protein